MRLVDESDDTGEHGSDKGRATGRHRRSVRTDCIIARRARAGIAEYQEVIPERSIGREKGYVGQVPKRPRGEIRA